MGDVNEDAIRSAHERGDMQEAVRRGLDIYQVEVYSFLCARLRSEADAHEVFSQLTEDIVRGITKFAWRASFRTWLYTLARNAAVRFETARAQHAKRHDPISQVSDPIAVERSRTRPYLRTDVKDRFAALRESLSPEEQSLLVLRIDRDLSWDEVARIMYDGDEADDEELQRHTTNLRQRFRQLKIRLEEWAKSEGLGD
ncbi:MAG TPA: sigma-70 family RNA polymerase sigma factor [Kofleriaceae bacterium]